jgi:hypothetical protein
MATTNSSFEFDGVSLCDLHSEEEPFAWDQKYVTHKEKDGTYTPSSLDDLHPHTLILSGHPHTYTEPSQGANKENEVNVFTTHKRKQQAEEEKKGGGGGGGVEEKGHQKAGSRNGSAAKEIELIVIDDDEEMEACFQTGGGGGAGGAEVIVIKDDDEVETAGTAGGGGGGSSSPAGEFENMHVLSTFSSPPHTPIIYIHIHTHKKELSPTYFIPRLRDRSRL